MPYQNDPQVGAEVSAYLLNLQKKPITQVEEITIQADANNPARLQRLYHREISDRIAIQETISGLSSTYL